MVISLDEDDSYNQPPKYMFCTEWPIEWHTDDGFQTRFEPLIGNDLYADMTVHLTLDDFDFPAHRLIVGTASETLQRLVFGADPANPTHEPVLVIDNVSMEHCFKFLMYLYNNAVHLTPANARCFLQHICPRFQLPELERICHRAAADYRRRVRVMPAFDAAIAAGDFHASLSCIRQMQYQMASMCTLAATRESRNMFQLSVTALRALLSADDRMYLCNEVRLFEGLILWARSIVERQQPHVAGGNLKAYFRKVRRVCAGRVELIRFGAMTSAEMDLCQRIVGNDKPGSGPFFFSADELVILRCDAYDYWRQQQVERPECAFPEWRERRCEMNTKRLQLFRVPGVREKYKVRHEALAPVREPAAYGEQYYGGLVFFTVDTDKPVLLVGLQMHDPRRNVRSVQLLADGDGVSESTVAGLPFIYGPAPAKERSCVLLRSPVQLVRNARYRLVVTMRTRPDALLTHQVVPGSQSLRDPLELVALWRMPPHGRKMKGWVVGVDQLLYDYLD